MPGGFVEEGEAPWEAAVRECLEESGVGVRPGPIVGVYHRPRQDLTVFVFRCGMSRANRSPPTEASDARWFPVEALPEPMVEVVHERIDDVRLGAEVTYRTQTGRGNADVRADG